MGAPEIADSSQSPACSTQKPRQPGRSEGEIMGTNLSFLFRPPLTLITTCCRFNDPISAFSSSSEAGRQYSSVSSIGSLRGKLGHSFSQKLTRRMKPNRTFFALTDSSHANLLPCETNNAKRRLSLSLTANPHEKTIRKGKTRRPPVQADLRVVLLKSHAS